MWPGPVKVSGLIEPVMSRAAAWPMRAPPVPEPVTAPPSGSVPAADIGSVTTPRPKSAWVTVYVAEHVIE